MNQLFAPRKIMLQIPSTPLRRPHSGTSSVIFEDKPHKKLIRRTLSYRQNRRHQSDSVTNNDVVFRKNLQSLKGLSNSAKVLNSENYVRPRRDEKRFNTITLRRKPNGGKNKRPVSLDLDAVARVLNAQWSDDFKVSLFNPNDKNLPPMAEADGATNDRGTLERNRISSGFKKSLRRKDTRKKLARHSAPLSLDNLKSPSLGEYLKGSWDNFFIKMTEKHSSTIRKYLLSRSI